MPKAKKLAMPSRLAEATLHKLRYRPAILSLKKISADTGIPAEWLFVFRTGTIAEPGVGRIEKLYEYLTGEPLEIK